MIKEETRRTELESFELDTNKFLPLGKEIARVVATKDSIRVFIKDEDIPK